MNFKVHVILNTINNAKKVPFRRFRGFKSHHFICPNDQIYTIRHGGNGQVSLLSWFLDFKQVPQASISPPTSTIFFNCSSTLNFKCVSPSHSTACPSGKVSLRALAFLPLQQIEKHFTLSRTLLFRGLF